MRKTMKPNFTDEEKEILKRQIVINKTPELFRKETQKLMDGDEQAKKEYEIYKRLFRWFVDDNILEDKINNEIYADSNKLTETREILKKFMLDK